jgi:sulfatase modifying factor 1
MKSTLTLTITLLCAVAAHGVTIITVPIGNPNNPADVAEDGYGAVPYEYRIGKYDVTNAQYVEFLNAAALSDPHFLYDTSMATSPYGGILRNGMPGNYSYSVKPDVIGAGPGGSNYTYANKPVNLVTWYDAIRFANWLNNGQGNSDTETGAYTLGTLDSEGNTLNGAAVVRNPGAKWFLPTHDEWYKAAYYNPIGGVYYDYPTGSNAVPNNNPPSSDTGNSANFTVAGHSTFDNPYPLTDVGAYTLSDSPYGTFDQGGNVLQWNETRFQANRNLAGGHWASLASQLASSNNSFIFPSFTQVGVGFRVASAVPEPSTFLLVTAACTMLSTRRRKPTSRNRV